MTTRAISELLVFSDDWGRHPSSCQHLIASLLEDTKVTWVNTIGTRPPRMDLVTAKRGIEKAKNWVSGAPRHLGKGPLPDNLDILDAKMWPWMTHSWDRLINRWLLSQQLADKTKNATVLTTIPLVADLIDKIPARRWVYYCVDDFSKWPGLDDRAMKHTEERLLKMADKVIAVSENLQEKVLQHRDQCDLLTHGVNLDHWNQVAKNFDWSNQNIPSPVYLFWGVIDQRMDTSWVVELSQQMTQGSIVLAGPEQNPEPKLFEIQRVHRLGAIPYEDLPAMAFSADVLIMPYQNSPVTRAMQPLKMKEYLATGKPVVARKLPAIEEWGDCSDLVSDARDFAKQVISRGDESTPHKQLENRKRLSVENWSSKADRLVQMIESASQ